MRTATLVSIFIASLAASPIVNKATDLTEVADSADLEVVDELVCNVLLGCKPNHKADTRRGGNMRKGEKVILDAEVEEELEESEDLDVSIKIDEVEEEEEEEIDVIITEETDDEEPEKSPYSKENHYGDKKSGKHGKKGSRY